MQKLSGRVAVVTGSSRGIGAAIVRRLASDGAKVIVHCATTLERAQSVASEIRNAGGSAYVVQADLGTNDGAATLVHKAFEAFGALDILVNNAAISVHSFIQQTTDENIDREITINLRAPIIAIREFARLTKSDQGRVINITSHAGQHAVYGRAVYSATKGGLAAATRSLALELGQYGITVNVVAPGTTRTEMMMNAERQGTGGWEKLFSKWTAMRRLGEPDDIADIVSFLASHEGRWVTGNTIAADGGLIAAGTNLAAFAQ